ncbi:MAG TPA: hypothetical protein VFZ53_08475 [Polyangiaceae bacterium]
MTSSRWTSMGLCAWVLAVALVSGCGDSKNGRDDDSSAGEAGAGGEGLGGASGGAAATGGTAGTAGLGATGGRGSGGTGAGGTGAGGTGAAGAGTGGTGADGQRDVTLTISSTFGFDDFGSPGAALAVAVDASSGFALVVALKFQLPFYRGAFQHGPALEAASGYRVAAAVTPLADEVATYPLVTAALTDTAGVRTMPVMVAAVLLEGDLEGATPQRIYVAHAGTVSLTREDGPYDILEGELSFTEVTNLGAGATVAPSGATIELSAFYFEWDTEEQP